MPFEPEETVGRYWHRLVGNVSTFARHPEAAAELEAVRGRLSVMFRAFGGAPALRIVPGNPTASGHRLGLRGRVGLGAERIDRAVLDVDALRLPAVIETFPVRQDNERLYEWLCAWAAHAVASERDPDPLRADILRLRAARAGAGAALAAWPGLTPLYHGLGQRLLAIWPRRSLPVREAEVDTAIQRLLGREGTSSAVLDAVLDPSASLDAFHAPRGYRSFAPVPLWGEVMPGAAGTELRESDEPGGISAPVDNRRRQANRRPTDHSRSGDPLILHRFETIFGLSDMVNVNRNVDDDDEESARQAADDLDELTIGRNEKRASARLKLDLDLASAEAEEAPIVAEITYPEWNWRKGTYHRDYCKVIAATAAEEGDDWTPDAAARRRIRNVRRQFEALRPKRETFHAQPDGDELDLSALVQNVADRRAGAVGSERVFLQVRNASRDLSLAVLMDVSLSTDAWLEAQGTSVLAVEKGALLALTHGLTVCGDEHAIFTFTSRRRHSVNVATVKDFDEPLGPRVERRIEALKSGQYTRIGAAIRHVSTRLAERPQRHRLLLLISDGKPNDIDHYEGRFGIEDTRMAVQEARRAGLRVFGVTIDADARDYVPYIFGRGAHAILPDISRLPKALPAIYRQITR